MVKFKKLIVVSFLAICLSSGFRVCAVEAAQLPTSAVVFSDEQVNEIKKYIHEEFEKLCAQKSAGDANEEVTKLREELAKQKKRAHSYKHKLDAKKDHVSPQDVQATVNKEKLALISEFSKYMAEFSNAAENKDKKLRHVDVSKMFQKFINLNLSLTLTNPGEVTVAQSAIQGKTK